MFIRDGRIVLDAPMEDVGERYVEVLVNADRVEAARALKPIDERALPFGKTVMLFDGVPLPQLAGTRRNPHAGPGRPVRRHDERNLRMNANVSMPMTRRAPVAAPHPTHKFALLLRREFWEHKGGFFWAPLVAGGIFLLLTLMGMIAGEVMLARAPDRRAHRGQRPARSINGLDLGMHHLEHDARGHAPVRRCASTPACCPARSGRFIAMAFVVFFYCLGALYDERKDRSVLFWKSLPLSDRDTVLSKVASAIVVAPLIAIAAALVDDVRLPAAVSGLVAGDARRQSRPAAVGPASPLDDRRPVRRGDSGLCAVGAADRRLAAAVLGVGAQQAVPVGDHDSGVRRHLRQLVRPDACRSTSSHSAGSGRTSWLACCTGTCRALLAYAARRSDTCRARMAVTRSDRPHAVSSVDYRLLLGPSTWIGAVAGAAMIFAAIRMRRWRDEG